MVVVTTVGIVGVVVLQLVLIVGVVVAEDTGVGTLLGAVRTSVFIALQLLLLLLLLAQVVVVLVVTAATVVIVDVVIGRLLMLGVVATIVAAGIGIIGELIVTSGGGTIFIGCCGCCS